MIRYYALIIVVFLTMHVFAKTIYLTDPVETFSTSSLYFPGGKLPEARSVNVYLIYEMGKSKVFNKDDNTKIFESDLQSQKIILSYGLLDNFLIYIGKGALNYSYDLNDNHIFINAYNIFLERQLNTYLTTSQYNLLFPFGFNPIMHPDRDRKDNIFGFSLKVFETKKIAGYLDFFKEDRDYHGIYYPLRIGFPPVPQTFVDFIMGIEDNYIRTYLAYNYSYFTLYAGFENLRRRTSMYDGSYDDQHDYQTYTLKLNAKYDRLEGNIGLKKDGILFNLKYQTPDMFGIEFNYRKIEMDIEDKSNYFSSIFNKKINFKEEEEIVGFAITQRF